jgi:ERCC4-related helicase
MSQPVDLSPMQRELDNLRLQLCHCNHAGTCLGCQGVDMLRQQVQMVVSAATQPVLMQVAQETQAKELMKQVQEMQERMMRDPEAAKAIEELLKYFQAPPPEDH